MPYITESSFPGPPKWQFNGHLQTIIPGVFRKVTNLDYTRERIYTADGDFLDLDWVRRGAKKLIILTHGLEGNSSRAYIKGAAKFFVENGWDALAWNCRSCSGEMNRVFKMYHHGDIEDLKAIVQNAIAKGSYSDIVLMGFSMGANITLKYMGVLGDKVPAPVKCAAVFSGPCDLESGAKVLDRLDNLVYKKRFLAALSKKVRHKHQHFPGRLQPEKLKKVKKWRQFDEWFSAPICGYKSAGEFYQNSSPKFFIEGIQRPTLLVNAENDPILTPECMPIELAKNHPYFYFEMPKHGGHCGFMTKKNDFSWAERRALEFSVDFLEQ